MTVLGLDVSGPGGGVALLHGGRTAMLSIPPGVRRGRDLVPLTRQLLADAGLAAGDLDGIACGVGPGSFTGIRIAVATAATLGYAAGRPVVDVGSLHGVAAGAPAGAACVLVALDARRGNVFCARFERADGELRLSGAYRCCPPGEAVAGLPGDAFVLGDAYGRHDALQAFAGSADYAVRPEVIAVLGSRRLSAGEGRRPEQLKPLYLRLSDPEERLR